MTSGVTSPSPHSWRPAPRRGPELAALLCGQMCVGAAGLFGALTLGGTSGLTACALRMLIAWGVVASWMAMLARRRPDMGASWRASRREEVLLAGAGAALAAHFALWIGSLASLPVTASSLLVSTAPLWGELWALVFLRRRPRPVFVAVLATTLAGTLLMLGGRQAWAGSGGQRLGAILGLASGAAQAATLLCVEAVHAGRRQFGQAVMPVGPVVLRSYGWAAAMLAVAAWATGGSPPGLDDGRTWTGILAMAGVSQLLGHTLVNRAVANFSAQLVILTALIRPAFAAILAAAVLGERLSGQGSLGALLVGVGIALALSTARPHSATASESI